MQEKQLVFFGRNIFQHIMHAVMRQSTTKNKNYLTSNLIHVFGLVASIWSLQKLTLFFMVISTVWYIDESKDMSSCAAISMRKRKR